MGRKHCKCHKDVEYIDNPGKKLCPYVKTSIITFNGAVDQNEEVYEIYLGKSKNGFRKTIFMLDHTIGNINIVYLNGLFGTLKLGVDKSYYDLIYTKRYGWELINGTFASHFPNITPSAQLASSSWPLLPTNLTFTTMEYIDISGPINNNGDIRNYLVYGKTSNTEVGLYYGQYGGNQSVSETYPLEGNNIIPILSNNEDTLIYFDPRNNRIIEYSNDFTPYSFSPAYLNSNHTILKLIKVKLTTGNVHFGIIYNDNNIELYGKNQNTPIISKINTDIKNITDVIITDVITIYQYPDNDTIKNSEVLILNKTNLSTIMIIDNNKLLDVGNINADYEISNPYFNVSTDYVVNSNIIPHNFIYVLRSIPTDIDGIHNYYIAVITFNINNKTASFSYVDYNVVAVCPPNNTSCTQEEKVIYVSYINLINDNHVTYYLGYLENPEVGPQTNLPRVKRFDNNDQDQNSPNLINTYVTNAQYPNYNTMGLSIDNKILILPDATNNGARLVTNLPNDTN